MPWSLVTSGHVALRYMAEVKALRCTEVCLAVEHKEQEALWRCYLQTEGERASCIQLKKLQVKWLKI